MGRLEGKIAVVTGGCGGVGSAIVARFAAEGAQVASFDRSAPSDDRPGVRDFRLDITSEAELSDAFAQVAAAWGVPTVLVNAAGITGTGKPIHEATAEDFDTVFGVNVKGTFLCTKHFLAPLLKAEFSGAIVNISSTYGVVGNGDIPLYHATKAAVRLLSKCDAVAYARAGIRSNAVILGSTRTEMTQKAMAESKEGEDYIRKLVDDHPMKRQAEPEEVAAAVLFLASDEASFVTGADIAVDGGYTAQ